MPESKVSTVSQQIPSLHATPVSAISNQYGSTPKSISPVQPLPSFHVDLPNAAKSSKPDPAPAVKLTGGGVIVIDDANDILIKEDPFLDELVPDDIELNSVLNGGVFPAMGSNQDVQPPSEPVPVVLNPAPESVSNLAPVNNLAPVINLAPANNLATVSPVAPAVIQTPAVVNSGLSVPVEVSETPSLFDGGIRMDMLPDVPTQAPITIGPSVINVHYSNNNRVAVVSE